MKVIYQNKSLFTILLIATVIIISAQVAVNPEHRESSYTASFHFHFHFD